MDNHNCFSIVIYMKFFVECRLLGVALLSSCHVGYFFHLVNLSLVVACASSPVL
jgi:hypothetical protein